MDAINKPKADIMDQIASYSQQEIENLIPLNLNNKYKMQ